MIALAFGSFWVDIKPLALSIRNVTKIFASITIKSCAIRMYLGSSIQVPKLMHKPVWTFDLTEFQSPKFACVLKFSQVKSKASSDLAKRPPDCATCCRCSRKFALICWCCSYWGLYRCCSSYCWSYWLSFDRSCCWFICGSLWVNIGCYGSKRGYGWALVSFGYGLFCSEPTTGVPA